MIIFITFFSILFSTAETFSTTYQNLFHSCRYLNSVFYRKYNHAQEYHQLNSRRKYCCSNIGHNSSGRSISRSDSTNSDIIRSNSSSNSSSSDISSRINSNDSIDSINNASTRYVALVSYDGSDYAGWQHQSIKRTIQVREICNNEKKLIQRI